MSKPDSGLFSGTKGEVLHNGDAEQVISSRAKGLDLREHPTSQKQLGRKARKAIDGKVQQRTATREEWKRREWDRRMRRRRKKGIDAFWAREAVLLSSGKKGTRNWTDEQIGQIISGNKPTFSGRKMESHHTFSVRLYPHLADRGEIIYPATHYEHRMGWHGGNYKESLPGKRIRFVNEF